MANENGNAKKGLGDKEKQVLFILVGLIFVALAYFLGFSKMEESRAVLAAENTTLQAEVDELERMKTNLAKVEADKQTYVDNTGKIYAGYPVELRVQNAIDYFDKIENAVKGIEFVSESFSMNSIFFQGGTVLESEVSSTELPEAVDANAPEGTEQEQPKEITGYHSTVAVSFTADHTTLRQILDYIKASPARTTVQNISISAAEGEKDLSCSMTVNLYSVGGQEKEYEELTIPQVQLYKKNIFK